VTAPALARGAVDRAVLRRDDPAWLALAWADRAARVLVLTPAPDPGGRRSSGWRAPVLDTPEGPRLALVPPSEAPPADPWLLGVDDAATPAWTVIGPPAPAGAEGPDDGGRPGGDGSVHAAPGARVRYADLWEVGAELGDRDAGLLTHAVALAQWHVRHPRCPRCGAPTRPAKAGAVRVCEVDGSEHFPRSDPAVIVLVHDGGDRCVLARQAGWPPHRYSVLAGFVEPGESAEQAVVREVAEEVALAVRDLAYRASQPWPFPSSLMLGYTARADPDDRTDLVADVEELEQARWVTRAELRAALAGEGELLLPPPVSIAHRLLRDFAA
jgi:NAD+ diphosphatase